MHLSSHSDRRRACSGRGLLGLPILAVGLFVSGCGEKGPPLPPVPKGPLAPSQVSSRQVGGQIQIGFVVPQARGDRPGQLPTNAELIRVSYPPGVEPSSDAAAFRRRGRMVGATGDEPLEPGNAKTMTDETVNALSGAGEGHTLRYGVRVRDRRGRASPLVVAPDLVPLLSVAPPQNLRGEPTADGIRLHWDAPDPEQSYRYNLYRPAAVPSALDDPLNGKPLDTTEFLDTTVTTGERYAYFVRIAMAQGSPYRESAASGTIQVLAADRFAPSAPRGLVAVQEGGAVRLFWDPNPERDVLGYRVYRLVKRDGVVGEWSPIGSDPVQRPLYLDTDVGIGQWLSYRVTAVDRAEPSNESAASDAVEVEVLAEPAPLGQTP